MRLTVFIIALFTLPAAGFAATLHVPGTYPTIQRAIDAAVNGDTVLVAPETYVENIDFKGKAILVTSSDGPEVTVIDGGGNLLSVVRFVTYEGPDCVIEGFTITNGKGTMFAARFGGGICCDDSSPTIRSNIIVKNTAEHGGGIGCIDSGAPTITGNIIMENTAQGHDASGGGGILCAGPVSPFISGNLITANIAKGSGSTVEGSAGGGVVVAYSASPIIMENVFLSNTAEHGGGIWVGVGSSSAVIKNNVFEKNWAEGSNMPEGSSGGGLAVGRTGSVEACCNLFYGNWAKNGGAVCAHGISDITFTNNTVWGNTATAMGGGACCYGSGSVPTVNNSILWDNSAAASMGPELGVGESGSVYIGYSD